MAYIWKHTQKSKEVFGGKSLGQEFQELLDEHRADLGADHRKIDHDWERLRAIGEQYGEQGKDEIILHLAMDYGLLDSAERYRFNIQLQIYQKEFFERLEQKKIPTRPQRRRKSSPASST